MGVLLKETLESGQYEVIDEIKRVEVLPLLVDILHSVTKGQLSVKDLDNAAGRMRIRLAKLQEMLARLDGINQTPSERKIMTDQLNVKIDRKKSILQSFCSMVEERVGKISEDNDIEMSVADSSAAGQRDDVPAESVQQNGVQRNVVKETIPVMRITDYLSQSMGILADNLASLVEHSSKLAEEEEKLADSRKTSVDSKDKQQGPEDQSKPNDNSKPVITSNNNMPETVGQPSDAADEDTLMGMDNQMGDNLDMFMDGALNLDDPGFDMSNVGNPQTVQNSQENKEDAMANKNVPPEPIQQDPQEIPSSKPADQKTETLLETTNPTDNRNELDDEEKFFNDNSIDLNDFNLNDLQDDNNNNNNNGDSGFGNFDDFGFDLDF